MSSSIYIFQRLFWITKSELVYSVRLVRMQLLLISNKYQMFVSKSIYKFSHLSLFKHKALNSTFKAPEKQHILKPFLSVYTNSVQT